MTDNYTPEQRDIIERNEPLRKDTGHRASMNAYYRHRSLLIDAAWIIGILLVAAWVLR